MSSKQTPRLTLAPPDDTNQGPWRIEEEDEDMDIYMLDDQEYSLPPAQAPFYEEATDDLESVLDRMLLIIGQLPDYNTRLVHARSFWIMLTSLKENLVRAASNDPNWVYNP